MALRECPLPAGWTSPGTTDTGPVHFEAASNASGLTPLDSNTTIVPRETDRNVFAANNIGVYRLVS
jgi:hypothetical protein